MSHIAPVSFKVATTLAAYRVVACATGSANTVEYPAAATAWAIGITADTVKDTVNSIPVVIGGIARLLFNTTVTTGQLVSFDSSGRGVPHVDTTAGSWVIGKLIGPTIDATGSISEVLIQPLFKSIP